MSHLVNTHWHFDHADGNEWLHSVGAQIIAHDNTRKHLSEIQRVEDWDYNFLPSAPGAIPSEVFTNDKTLKLNGSTIGLRYYGPAHTDSDICVTFAEANVTHVGDTFWNGIYPFIDYSTGGSIDGMIAASEANLAATDDQTIIVPGHGKPVSNKAELKEFRDMLVTIRGNVAQTKEARAVARRDGRRQTHRRFRRKVGPVCHRPCILYQVGLRGGVITRRIDSCFLGVSQPSRDP